MRTVTSVEELRSLVREARQRGDRIGFVPTMGALHEGHASLLRAARERTGCVVASIFVNPTQFGPSEDFSRYPRPLDADQRLCQAEKVDLLFLPSVETMYPPGHATAVRVSGLDHILEGAVRPGHFQGVATVVAMLFNQVQPDLAFFGQKDAQQAAVLRRLTRDLHFPIEIIICPTVREADGLACSSRNVYLSPSQRAQATVLYRSLELARRMIREGQRQAALLRQEMGRLIHSAPEAKIDYVEIVDPLSMEPLQALQGQVLIVLAVRFGSTRLIDNDLVEVP